MPKAYPVYDEGYLDALAVVRDYLADLDQPAGGRPQRHAQVQQPGPLDGHRDPGGRRTCSAGTHDVWAVNADDEYHEEVQIGHESLTADVLADLRRTQPMAPQTGRR